MTGFLNSHGTSACISGYFLPSSAFEEQDEYRNRSHDWASVEELASYDFDEDFVEHGINMRESDGDTDLFGLDDIVLDATGIVNLHAEDNPYRDFDPIYWGYCRENINIGVVREGAEVFALNIEQFENNCFVSESHIDSFLPSFSSCNRTNLRPSNQGGEIDRHNKKTSRMRKNYGSKSAKFRIDGTRARKDSRDNRIGNRQKFAEHRDYWVDVYDICEVLDLEYNPHAIPQFGIEVVGLTDDEASYYEAENRVDIAAYWEELESSWDYHFDELDHSDLFEPVNDLVVDTWERHLFPNRYERCYPHLLSSWDYYDDWGDTWFDDWRIDDSSEDDRYCDDIDLDDFDDGPTAEEWAEIDHIFAENDDEEVFIGSFKGLTRTNVIGRQNRSALNRQLMFG